MSYFTDRCAVLEGGLKKVWNSKHTDTQEIDGGLGGSDVQTSELVSYILPPPEKKGLTTKRGSTGHHEGHFIFCIGTNERFEKPELDPKPTGLNKSRSPHCHGSGGIPLPVERRSSLRWT